MAAAVRAANARGKRRNGIQFAPKQERSHNRMSITMGMTKGVEEDVAEATDRESLGAALRAAGEAEVKSARSIEALAEGETVAPLREEARSALEGSDDEDKDDACGEAGKAPSESAAPAGAGVVPEDPTSAADAAAELPPPAKPEAAGPESVAPMVPVVPAFVSLAPSLPPPLPVESSCNNNSSSSSSSSSVKLPMVTAKYRGQFVESLSQVSFDGFARNPAASPWRAP